ncbi:MAG TPA: hypothetical protein VFB60_12150 [Ktedonobacteraceae bacterium]|nr:hypothetical protein [Ktedonobacteraceae bacterium]
MTGQPVAPQFIVGGTPTILPDPRRDARHWTGGGCTLLGKRKAPTPSPIRNGMHHVGPEAVGVCRPLHGQPQGIAPTILPNPHGENHQPSRTTAS